MVNKVILIGNLGKDPEAKTLDNGTKVASFSMATTEKYKDKNSGEMVETTTWHDIVVWRGLADVVERFLTKGSKVYIEGKITSRSWEQDGVTKYRTEIIANNLTMLGGQQSSSPVQSGQDVTSEEASDDLPF